MITREIGSMADIDTFSKAVVKDGQCQIRLRNGEPVMRCCGNSNLDAIRKFRKLLDQLAEDTSKKSNDLKT
jgi:hypothetical protein